MGCLMDEFLREKIFRGIIRGYDKEKKLLEDRDCDLIRSIASEVQKEIEGSVEDMNEHTIS